jgi:hypothetical protein
MTEPVTEASTQNAASASGLWWLAREGKAAGPYDRAEVERGLRAGTIGSQDLACPDGQATWRPLDQWPAFALLFHATPNAAATMALVPPPLPATKSPWNPRWIAFLGILCSPLWAAGMAAANARRLRTGPSAWRPILIAITGLAATWLVDACFAPGRFWAPWFTHLALYAATLWALWRLVLRRQAAAYDNSGPHPLSAKWLWPGVVAAPLAIYVLLVFVLAPFAPLEPREVAQRYLEADRLKDAQRYSTPRLWPAEQALVPLGGGHAGPPQYQLTFDRDGEPGSQTHFVGYVYYVNDAGGRHTMDGSMRLVDYDGGWKVDEVFFDAYDSRPLARQVVVSADYPLLVAAITSPGPAAADAPQPQPAVPEGTPQPAPAPSPPSSSPQTDAAVARTAGPALGRLLTSDSAGSAAAESRAASAAAREADEAAHGAGSVVTKGGKAAGAGLLAVAAMLFKGLGSLFGGGNEKRGAKPAAHSAGSTSPPAGPAT